MPKSEGNPKVEDQMSKGRRLPPFFPLTFGVRPSDFLRPWIFDLRHSAQRAVVPPVDTPHSARLSSLWPRIDASPPLLPLPRGPPCARPPLIVACCSAFPSSSRLTPRPY